MTCRHKLFSLIMCIHPLRENDVLFLTLTPK
jgi:hypothetical protein